MPPSRSSDNHHQQHHHRNPSNYRGGFSGGHHQRQLFDSPPPPNHPPGGGGGGFRPMSAGGFGGGGPPPPVPPSGQKRGFSFSGRIGSPPPAENTDSGGFAKLFVGSVPRTATEEDVRPLFEEHGDVVEVALIKDKRTGQQQGCCFIKFATSEEADRAIRSLHNQYTLPGGAGPIQVRYADGERERLGAVEHKLFVGSLNRQATEKDVEQIFTPFGRVEDVYIMRDELKQSRGCGFVKYSHREMATEAISALSGVFVMKGCDQPLTVRFADPKRPRTGESRGGPAFGGPGFGPRPQVTSGFRQAPNLGDPMGGHAPPNTWNPISPQTVGTSSDANAHSFGSFPRGAVPPPILSTTGGPLGGFGGPTNGSLPALAALPSTTSQQNFNPPMSQVPSVGSQISPLQKPLQSPQHLLPPLQLQNQQTSVSYSQTQTSQPSIQQLGQLQLPNSAARPSLSQPLPSQQLFGSGCQMPVSQPQVQQSASSVTTQPIPLNLQRQGVSATTTQQLSLPSTQQQLLQPIQHSPSQLAQVLSQQTQALQASFQSSQQAFSQLQQQLHMMQQSGQNVAQQPSSQVNKQQSPWTGGISQTQAVSSALPTASTTSAAPVIPINTQTTATLACNWTEHTSPEGYKYYYNSITTESRWEKPEELTLFEQQQPKLQHQQKPVQQLQSQPQSQSHQQVLPTQQISQTQIQLIPQIRNQQQVQLQQPSLSSSYQASGVIGHPNTQDHGYAHSQALVGTGNDPARFQKVTNSGNDPARFQQAASSGSDPAHFQQTASSGSDPARFQQTASSASDPSRFQQVVSSGSDPARFQQGLQAQDWMWKNKPAGT